MDSGAVTKQVERLILIYNADSGVLSAAFDSLKKVLSLESCALCAITHGTFTQRGEWAQCARNIVIPVEYLHKDELTPALSGLVKDDLPCVVVESNERLVILLGPDAIRRCRGRVELLRAAMIEKAERMGLEIPGL